MDPSLILAALKSGFDFGTELLKFLQTPQGQQTVAKGLQDRATWDAFWSEVGNGIRSLFTGQLFEAEPPAKALPPKPSLPHTS